MEALGAQLVVVPERLRGDAATYRARIHGLWMGDRRAPLPGEWKVELAGEPVALLRVTDDRLEYAVGTRVVDGSRKGESSGACRSTVLACNFASPARATRTTTRTRKMMTSRATGARREGRRQRQRDEQRVDADVVSPTQRRPLAGPNGTNLVTGTRTPAHSNKVRVARVKEDRDITWHAHVIY